MRHILKGFIELIKKGILHKNLKPKNILYHNGLMRISDFGLQNLNQRKNIY
jgi:serine/threonine protein kinase